MGCSESRSNEIKVKKASKLTEMTKEQEIQLYESIIDDDIQKVTDSIDCGFDINIKMKSLANRTFLHIACENGSEKTVNLLVQKGCKLDEKDDYGMTPMFLSILKEQKQCLSILKKAGACLDNNDFYPDRLSSDRSFKQSIRRLKSQASIKNK